MSLNLTCLNRSGNIRVFSTKSSDYFHSIYQSNGQTFLTRFSSLITSSTFSTNDLQLLLKNLSNNHHWKFPTKLISSMIIYSSLTILLFVTCSIIFYLISYSNLNKFQPSKYRIKTISILILVIFYIVLLIEMIFIIENLNQIKLSLDQSLEEMNENFNSKTFSKHIKYLLRNFDNFSSNSILIDQSKMLMIKTFENLLEKNYFLEEINLILNNINKYFNQIIENEYLKNSFKQFVNSYRDMIEDFTNLNKKVCYFIDENHLQIEEKIFSLLNLIRKQFEYFIEIVDEQFFKQINLQLFDQKIQQQIRSTISILTTSMIISITFITIIPMAFFILITINYFYLHFYQNSNSQSQYENNIRLDHLDVRRLQSFVLLNNSEQLRPVNPFRDVHRNLSETRKGGHSARNSMYKTNCSYHLYLNPIRIAFAFLTILLIILCVLSGLFYGVDLFFQSSCRLVHYDQSFLVSLATDNLIQSIDGFDVNKTLNNLINDCNKKIHFSQKFFEEFSVEFSNELLPFLIHLNENIYKQFLSSIQMINISSELRLINHLAGLARLTDILNLINHIQKEFNQINQIFKQIIEQNSQLSNEFLTETINDFEFFLKKVIESTIDSCPLPMNNILKIDRLICHETAFRTNGLWLRIFFFMFAVVSTLCIFGIFIYKKLN